MSSCASSSGTPRSSRRPPITAAVSRRRPSATSTRSCKVIELETTMAESKSRRGPRHIDPKSRCGTVEEWPVLDRAAWAAAVKQGSVLEPGGPASHWSPASLRKTSKGWGRYLAWLAMEHLLDDAAGPVERVTRERV